MKRRDSRGACWPQRRLRAGAFRAGRLPKSGPRRRCLHCRSGGHLWRGQLHGTRWKGDLATQPSGLGPSCKLGAALSHGTVPGRPGFFRKAVLTMEQPKTAHDPPPPFKQEGGPVRTTLIG
jgi:hypothetical protein